MPRRILLVIFDLDGTLTPVDSLWSFLHDAFGTLDNGKTVEQKYRRGEISYKEWAETDAKSWSGISYSALMDVLKRIPYTKDAEEVFEALRAKQVKIGIVSAGLSILADKAAEELGADIAVSNELELQNGTLTGRINVRVSVTEKAQVIREIAAKFGISLSEVALVGDRALDLPIDECLRIAFRPKNDTTRSRANVIIEDDNLSRVLHYLK